MPNAISDTFILIMLIVFLGSFIYVQGLFGTEMVQTQAGWVSNYSENTTQVGISGTVQAPPTCSPVRDDARSMFAAIGIGTSEYEGSCTGDWLGWITSLLFFKSSVGWINALIIVPILVAIAYLIARFGRGLS